ncbi:MAG: hypothetical protein GTN99_02930 [Candidatus Dadabacteria bacterium]|nr:hypothetical protein [Candidatus Dadabacteria bacterium]
MGQKPEARFIQSIERYLSPLVYRQSMYTPYSNGTPDRYYEGPYNQLWVEYKFTTALKPRPFKPIDLVTKLQAKWLLRAYKNGIPVAIILGNPKGGAMYMNKELECNFQFKPIPRRELAEMILWYTCGPLHTNKRGDA